MDKKERNLAARQAGVKEEEEEFLRIKATVINGKNARELAEMTKLLEETSAHVKRLHEEKGQLLREKIEVDESSQRCASELDALKQRIDQEGKVGGARRMCAAISKPTT